MDSKKKLWVWVGAPHFSSVKLLFKVYIGAKFIPKSNLPLPSLIMKNEETDAKLDNGDNEDSWDTLKLTLINRMKI